MTPLDGNLSELECLVERVKTLGLSVCADLDEDCWHVADHQACWLHEKGTGICPFLAMRL